MAAEEYLRKRKATDFFSPMAAEEIVHESEPDVRLICADGQVNNIFFNQDNISKQCAQGAIANLLNMLQCSKEELEIFWHLANSDEHVIEKQLREQVPTKVKKVIWCNRKVFMDTQETIHICYNKETQLEEIDVSQTDA